MIAVTTEMVAIAMIAATTATAIEIIITTTIAMSAFANGLAAMTVATRAATAKQISKSTKTMFSFQ